VIGNPTASTVAPGSMYDPKEQRRFLQNLKQKNTGALAKFILNKAKEDPKFDINEVILSGFITDPTGVWVEAESTVIRLRKIVNKFPERVDLNLIREFSIRAGNLYRLAHVMKHFPEIKFTKSDARKFAESFDKNSKEKFAMWHFRVLEENPKMKKLLENTSVVDFIKTFEIMES
jgi:hypothetical protein